MRNELHPLEELDVTPLPAFNDNYLWLLSRDGRAAIVDPGDPAPVMLALTQRGLDLTAILRHSSSR